MIVFTMYLSSLQLVCCYSVAAVNVLSVLHYSVRRPRGRAFSALEFG